MDYSRLLLYITFGVLPSLIWLFYYLGKDLHPEPKRMILKVFMYGALITVPVFFIQLGLSELLKQLRVFAYLPKVSLFFTNYPIAIQVLKWFLVIAVTEEIAKYLVVRLSVFKSKELDEPLDIMIYMVIAALGFAAVENILYLWSPLYNISFNVTLQTTITISFFRFIGATFLHTLCSALIGYFMALSSLRRKRGFRLTVLGICLAALLHGFYNFSIITLQDPFNMIIPIVIIVVLCIFMLWDFDEIKKIKGICKL